MRPRRGGRGIFLRGRLTVKKRVYHRVAALRRTFDVDILFNTLFLESHLKRPVFTSLQHAFLEPCFRILGFKFCFKVPSTGLFPRGR
jgi:hypothetical protein